MMAKLAITKNLNRNVMVSFGSNLSETVKSTKSNTFNSETQFNLGFD